MRGSSCQIHFDQGSGNAMLCGKPAVADCADCGISLCFDCRTECCGESFCDYCYEYHANYSCPRKTAVKHRIAISNENAA